MWKNAKRPEQTKKGKHVYIQTKVKTILSLSQIKTSTDFDCKFAINF